MSEARNLILERVNRLSQAVADLMESHAAQGRMLLRRLDSIDESLTAMKHAVRDLASEQTLLGNRIEEAFARAMRANVRLDDFEDKPE